MTTDLRALLSEIAGDCLVAYGITEENYRAFCRNGAMGKMPSSTWPEHCQSRLEQIEKAIAALDAQAGMVMVPRDALLEVMRISDREHHAWREVNDAIAAAPAGPVEGGEQ